MENTRSRGRKRYCCCYCNVYFYQVDSWQRHNRKHTGVEIECDDCGEMCSDSFELKSHQQLCEAYRVYSEDIFTEVPLDTEKPRHKNNSKSAEDVHETPDSTSKQESLTDDCDYNARQSPWQQSQTTPTKNNDTKDDEDARNDEESNSKHSGGELDDLIGEDKEGESNDAGENEDPETEALIGVDETEEAYSNTRTSNDDSPSKQLDNNIGVDSQIVIKVESALNDPGKRNIAVPAKEQHHNIDSPHHGSRPGGVESDRAQSMNIENSDLNKKYQPYFCKNCGARFTRKDSVTRHLKKGTCSGKSAIVCNICGKVFPEMYELQEHFRLNHKNIFPPPSVVNHRAILPKPSEPRDNYPYASHFVMREIPPGARPYGPNLDQGYRTIHPSVQPPVFYSPSGSQHSSYRHRFNQQNYREHYGNRQFDMKFSSSGGGHNEMKRPSDDVMVGSKHSRKREYADYARSSREVFYDRHDEMKKSKGEFVDKSDKERSNDHKGDHKQQINLSEYTNQAMNSQQYFNKRYSGSGNEPPQVSPHEKDEASKTHHCKICGAEFSRYEYLITHLRKHKEKDGIDSEELHHAEQHQQQVDNKSEDRNEKRHMNESTSSDDSNNEKLHNNNPDIGPYTSTSEPITIVLQPTSVSYSSNQSVGSYAQKHGELSFHHPQPGSTQDGSMDTITPGVDGKFRPFICENCGQRFTRKDSLVRHAKKQTCFEEQPDLKCKHCDKTFRYHKCLMQHQELVHGISREEQSRQMMTDEEDSDSDKSSKNETFHQQKKDDHIVAEPGRYPNEIKQREDMHNMNNNVNSKPPYHILPPPHPQRTIEPPFNHQRPPYHHHHAPSFRPIHRDQPMPPPPQSGKFILPKSEEKFRQPPPSLENAQPPVPPSQQQDQQFIGYCTVPRPFQCEYCGDRFAHRHSLKRHVRRHLGIGIPCHECGKLYRDQSEWRRHQRSIHNRHYEKYEVPNRVSYRDGGGVDTGLIGVVQNNEYNADHEGASDTDEDDDTSVKKKTTRVNDSMNKGEQKTSQHHRDHEPQPAPQHLSKNQNTENEHLYKEQDYENIPPDTIMVTPSNQVNSCHSTPTKEEREDEKCEPSGRPFNFKVYSSTDKDSRKSALDRYLRSPQSDEDENAENQNANDDNNNENSKFILGVNSNNTDSTNIESHSRPIESHI